ncbi:DUF6252 family protein [Adhaeribacter soli]|uniref:Uncharacterized protein n=1 Tax=Adhaeribacter soli TaxID=2607655 RepID=A0A5N1ITP8_9BACT|nr:DUF6252 family protein [Adhaeribacter soli]KAA9331736.1 hypothetical protein F0P94_13070 [Adhaeribacter soli]
MRGQFWVVGAKLDLENDERIAVRVFGGVISPGTYKLSMYQKQYGSFAIDNNCEYETDSLNTGTLEITRLDSINYIVSGRFSFSVTKPGCGTVHITDGRFDVKYGY